MAGRGDEKTVEVLVLDRQALHDMRGALCPALIMLELMAAGAEIGPQEIAETKANLLRALKLLEIEPRPQPSSNE